MQRFFLLYVKFHAKFALSVLKTIGRGFYVDTTSENFMAVSLPDVVSTAIQVPGVRVNRDAFLCEIFKEVDRDVLQSIIEKGPVAAGVERSVLKQKAHKLIQARTALSTGASFAAGLPGGLAMAATIPADMLQFYGVSLRMAQELAYLYGEPDLWEKDLLDRDKVTNQLILYCGVMFGATGHPSLCVFFPLPWQSRL